VTSSCCLYIPRLVPNACGFCVTSRGKIFIDSQRYSWPWIQLCSGPLQKAKCLSLGPKLEVIKFPERKSAHVGMDPSKTNQTRWELHHNTFTIPTVSCCQLCLVISCVPRRVVEGSRMCSVGVCSACWCAWGVCYVVVAAESSCYWAREIWSVLYVEAVECMSSTGSVWHVKVSL